MTWTVRQISHELRQMKYVVRVRYGPHLECLAGIGYLTRDGHCTCDLRDACIYTSEGEAWEHLMAAGVFGSENGEDWAWVEEA